MRKLVPAFRASKCKNITVTLRDELDCVITHRLLALSTFVQLYLSLIQSTIENWDKRTKSPHALAFILKKLMRLINTGPPKYLNVSLVS